eukprot:s1950_g6.t4
MTRKASSCQAQASSNEPTDEGTDERAEERADGRADERPGGTFRVWGVQRKNWAEVADMEEEYNTLAMPGMAQPNTGEVRAVPRAEPMNRLNTMNLMPPLPAREAKTQPDARQRAASPTKEAKDDSTGRRVELKANMKHQEAQVLTSQPSQPKIHMSNPAVNYQDFPHWPYQYMQTLPGAQSDTGKVAGDSSNRWNEMAALNSASSNEPTDEGTDERAEERADGRADERPGGTFRVWGVQRKNWAEVADMEAQVLTSQPSQPKIHMSKPLVNYQASSDESDGDYSDTESGSGSDVEGVENTKQAEAKEGSKDLDLALYFQKELGEDAAPVKGEARKVEDHNVSDLFKLTPSDQRLLQPGAQEKPKTEDSVPSILWKAVMLGASVGL